MVTSNRKVKETAERIRRQAGERTTIKLICRNRFYVVEPKCLVFKDIAWHGFSKPRGNDIKRLARYRIKRLRLVTALEIVSDLYR